MNSLPSWGADKPCFISCGKSKTGKYVACGLSAEGQLIFQTNLPSRGHEIICHPQQAVAIVFARRPGYYALAIDILTGQTLHHLQAPEGRHFYGHGVFSEDGTLLFTTENAYDDAKGVIGIWSVFPFRRLGEFFSGGVGPHDIALLPNEDSLAVANGGLETHPLSGRHILNAHNFKSNLTLLSSSGSIKNILYLPEIYRSLSIRHLSIGSDNMIAFAMQNQEQDTLLPLAGTTQENSLLKLATTPKEQLLELKGYVGSISFNKDKSKFAITSPRGGAAHIFNSPENHFSRTTKKRDVCGIVAALDAGFIATTGNGLILHLGDDRDEVLSKHDIMWDNHLIKT